MRGDDNSAPLAVNQMPPDPLSFAEVPGSREVAEKLQCLWGK